MNLFEGLKEGDLLDLVLPVISIDEYESKLDDTSIVVGFYVNSNAPAKDLNRFIQKSPESLYDTEISPAPNEDGYYIVFLEIQRDDEFPAKIVSIANSLNTLTGNDEWYFVTYGEDEEIPLTEENIKEYIDF